jgi:hypothetical protein
VGDAGRAVLGVMVFFVVVVRQLRQHRHAEREKHGQDEEGRESPQTRLFSLLALHGPNYTRTSR